MQEFRAASRPFAVLVQALAILTICIIFPPMTSVDSAPSVELDDFDPRAVEASAVAVAERVTPCTVGIQVGRAQASGVIVSPDGYVLTAAHVVGAVGREAMVVLPDGKSVRGESLGINPDIDGGLIKITEEGEWPYAEMAPAGELTQRGEWCIAIGHPGGFDRRRTPPVRLGRVIQVERFVIRTDCPIAGGDSGGPLFDLKGRVIGIHSRIAESATVNLHVPVTTFQETWEALKKGEVTRHAPSSQFVDRFDINRDGSVHRQEIPPGVRRKIFDRLAAKYGFDATKEHTIDEIRTAIGLSIAPATQTQRFLPERLVRGLSRNSVSLASDRFTRGSATRALFRYAVESARSTCTEVLRDGRRVAFGTIVDPSGLVLTKASQLWDPKTPRSEVESIALTCRLADSRNIPAKLARIEAAWDVALLQLSEPVDVPELKHTSSMRSGQWVVSVGLGRDPLSLGVVSVPERTIPRSNPVMGIALNDTDDGPIIIGVAEASGADVAGLLAGDRISHIMGKVVRSVREVQMAVRSHRVGDTVAATIIRPDGTREIEVVLGMQEDAFEGGPEPVAGELSRRRDDFPAAVQHDSVLAPNQCGSLVVDVNGNMVGVNIARSGRVSSLTIPVASIDAIVVAHLLEKAESEATKTADSGDETPEKE